MLFDDDLKKIVKEFSDSSDNILLYFWHLVFDERFELYRNYLEKLFSVFDETVQRRFKAKLSKDYKGVYEIVNEIIIGSYFINLGYSAEYEPNISGKTPDWIIKTPNNQKIIIDIFTSNTPIYMKSQFEVASEITNSVKKLPFSVQLFGDILDAHTASRNVLKITEEISNWLKLKPNPQERFSSNGVEILLSRYTDKPYTILTFSIDDSKRNDFRDLPGKITGKADKYEKISSDLGIPFVVAIAFDRMLVDEETIEHLVCNFPTSYSETRYSYNEKGEKVIKGIFVPDGKGGMFQLEDRHEEGVFRKDSLSGVLTFWFHSRNFIGIKLFKNPKATFPLPEGIDFKIVETGKE